MESAACCGRFSSEIFGVAECEIIPLRKLWNISRRLRLWSMWNEICPHSRQRIFHICGANISQRSYFTCPQGKFRWKKHTFVRWTNVCFFLAGVAGFGPTNARVKVWCLTAWLYPKIFSFCSFFSERSYYTIFFPHCQELYFIFMHFFLLLFQSKEAGSWSRLPLI